LSKIFAPANPNTAAMIVMSPTLSLGQIRIVRFSGLVNLDLFLSRHLRPAKNNPSSVPAKKLPAVEKMNSWGSLRAPLTIKIPSTLYPKTNPKKKLISNSSIPAGFPTSIAVSL
jgi:hypothetical protein